MEADIDHPTHRSRQESETSKSGNAQWRFLFAFTCRSHVLPLCIAVVLSVASGAVTPILSYLLGKIFDNFTSFGAGKFDGTELVKRVSKYAIGLTGLGAGSGLLHTGYFGFWLTFGELQAKCARDSLYAGMLEKDMEWYDMRKDGIETLIQRLQTYVQPFPECGNGLMIPTGRFASFRWPHHSPLDSPYKAQLPRSRRWA